MAMAIFAVVATALAGVLTSSIGARSIASDRTGAEQVANSQLEFVRSISYANVGLTVNGNPSGVVDAAGDQSAQGGPTVPSDYAVSIKISWVDDSIPTSPATKANYKNVTVTVFRARDSKVLSVQSTQIGPRQRAPYGGINKGIVNVQVQDFYPNAPRGGVLVNLSNGPSSPLADTSDSGGTDSVPGARPGDGLELLRPRDRSVRRRLHPAPRPERDPFPDRGGLSDRPEGPAGVQAGDPDREVQ